MWNASLESVRDEINGGIWKQQSIFVEPLSYSVTLYNTVSFVNIS